MKSEKIIHIEKAEEGKKRDYTMIVNDLLQQLKQVEESVILSFSPGVYHFYPDYAPKRAFHTSNTDTRNHPIKRVCILIESLENITIEGNDSMFIFHGDVMGIGIFHSQNIRIQNLSWDYGVSTLSEMTVLQTGVENDQPYADYQIGSKVPYEISKDEQSFYWLSERSPYTGELYWKEKDAKNDMVIVGFDKKTNVKRRYSVNEGPFSTRKNKVKEIQKGIIRIYYDQVLPPEVVQNRVFEYCKVTDRNTAGAFIWESECVSLTDVNIHYLHGFGFLIQMSGNISFLRTHFVPNSKEGKYGSSFADSIHVSGAKGKVSIRDCTFKHPHDDPINIHGTFTRIQKIIDTNTLEVIYAHHQQSGFPQYHKGDKVVFFDRATMDDTLSDEYKIVDVVHPGEAGNDLQTMQVTLDKTVPFDTIKNDENNFKYVMENVTYTPEVEIINNRFSQVPTRGILCTTRKKVLIENNHFEHITMSPIFISNDSNEWYESGPVRDLTIRGNVFHITKVEGWKFRKAAIYVHPIPLANQLSPVPIHKNITIEDNTFYMEHECVVSAENVENLVIKRNKIIRTNTEQQSKTSGLQTTPYNEEYPNDHAVLFEFDTCRRVIIESNIYKSFKPYVIKKRMNEKDLHIQEDDVRENNKI